MNLQYAVVASILALFPASAFAISTQDLAQMLLQFQTNIPALYRLVVATSFVLGIAFVTAAIFRLKKYGQALTMMSAQSSMGKPILLFFIGIALIYFPTSVNVIVQTLWVSGSDSIIKYPDEPSSWDALIHPIIDVVRLFGLIFFVRGMVILTRLASESPQQGVVSKGLVHIIGGVLLINIVGTWNVIKYTFGLS